MDNTEEVKVNESVQRVAAAISSYLNEKQNVKLDEWTVSDVEIAMKKKYGKVDKKAIEKLKKVQHMGNVDRNDLVKVGHGKLNVESIEIDEAKKQGLKLQCQECGKVFTKKIGPKTVEVQCPKCKGFDVDVAKEEVELDEKTKWKMGDGRPRGGAYIENERFWDLPKDSLEYIIKDAGEAIKANPKARKATTGRGNWADQINDAASVLGWRKKNGIKEEAELDEVRQLKDPKKEVMVVKNKKVIVIDKKDAKEYLNKGWELAEEQEAELDEDIATMGAFIFGGFALLPAMIAFPLIDAKMKGKLSGGIEKTVGNMISKFKKDKNYKPTSAEVAASKELEKEVKKENPSLFKKVMAKVTKIKSKKEETELDEGEFNKLPVAAKTLAKYAVKHKKGPTPEDYDVFMWAAGMMKTGRVKDLAKYTMKQDTDVRDKIIDIVKDTLGKAATEKIFPVKIREQEVDESVQRVANALSYHEARKLSPSARAKRDALRDIGRDKSKDDDEVKATDADRERADRNIINKLKKSADVKGNYEIKFDKGPAKKVSYKLVQYALDKNEKMKPADKLKFQNELTKSYKDFLKALKDM